MLWWAVFLKVELFPFLMANLKSISDSELTADYVNSVEALVSAFHILHYVEPDDMQERMARLVDLEEKYALRGFRTIDIKDFTRAGGRGEDIADLVGVKRKEGEAPIFHARKFQQNYRTPYAWAGASVLAALETGKPQRGKNPAYET